MISVLSLNDKIHFIFTIVCTSDGQKSIYRHTATNEDTYNY